MKNYLDHLYALVNGRVDLYAIIDIVDTAGNLVAKSDGLISPETYKKLKGVDLNVDLYNVVKFARPLTSDDLLHQIKQQITWDESLKAIHAKFGDDALLQECSEYAFSFPYSDEILTAFSIEMSQLYNQSLFSACLSCAMGKIQKMEKDDIKALFLATIFHDVGLLFISRKVRNHEGKLTGDQWRKMQLHPIVAEKMFRGISSFPKHSRKAILDHHENTDGSGYPYGKTVEKISKLGLMVGLIDNACAIYRKKLKPLNRNMYDIYPIMQMNTHNYPQDLLSSALYMLKQVPPSINKDVKKETVKDLIEYTYDQQQFINKFMDILSQIHRNIEKDYGIKILISLINEYKQLVAVINTSGLVESNYIDWLQRLEKDGLPELYNEVEHTRLMLEEIMYRLNNYYNQSSTFVSRASSDLADGFKLFLTIYSSATPPKIPPSVKNFWGSSEDSAKETHK